MEHIIHFLSNSVKRFHLFLNVLIKNMRINFYLTPMSLIIYIKLKILIGLRKQLLNSVNQLYFEIAESDISFQVRKS